MKFLLAIKNTNDKSKNTLKMAKECVDLSDNYITGNLPNLDMNPCTSNLNVEPKKDEMVVVNIEYANEEVNVSNDTSNTERIPKTAISPQNISNHASKSTFEKDKLYSVSSDECVKSNLDNRDMKEFKNKREIRVFSVFKKK